MAELNPETAGIRPLDVLRMFVDYPLRWLVPTVAVAVLATVFALVKPDSWEASQALVVRNNAASNTEMPGRFRTPEELKALLETLLEVAKTRGVLRTVLVEVGPPADADAETRAAWPSEQDIADFSDAVKIVPPKGAEFGKTEIFYLKVKDEDRLRALKLTDLMCRQLQRSYAEVRKARAVAIASELSSTVGLARKEVDLSTTTVRNLESEAGADLSELRNLAQDSGGGEGNLRHKLLELESELRDARLQAANRSEVYQAFYKARQSQDQVLALPNGLLEGQPSLKRLKDGLLDAQVNLATLLGTMSPEHPAVRAAQVAEQEISTRLQQELDAAARGVEIEARLERDRVAMLEGQLAEVRARVEKLARLRVDYANGLSELQHRAFSLTEAERRLLETRSLVQSSDDTSLLSRIDQPDTGPKPAGPGKTILLLAGIAGGLVTGVGVLLLTAEPRVHTSPSLPSSVAATASSDAAAVPSETSEAQANDPEKVGNVLTRFKMSPSVEALS